MSKSPFDLQAEFFDKRVATDLDTAYCVGRVLRRLAAMAHGNLLLDVGAGTGIFGRFAVVSDLPYVGLDVSLPMLRTFRLKLSESTSQGTAAFLAVADANRDWPIRSGAAGVVFFSRSAHLLCLGHVAKESIRVLSSGRSFLVLGRVRRSPQSVRALLRGRMRQLLQQHSVAGKNGETTPKDLIFSLSREGCVVRDPCTIVCARWTVEEIPETSLTWWRNKEGLAGVPIPADIKDAVLENLEKWALSHFGTLQQAHISEEQYELTIFETTPTGLNSRS